MNSEWFVQRERCPACHGRSLQRLYKAPYDAPPLRAYVEKAYTPKGAIGFDCLHGAHYALAECRDCDLIFQEEVPNDPLSSALYGEWIDPEVVFTTIEETANLQFYSWYAQEIMQIVAWLGKPPAELAVFDFGMGWGKWARMARAFGCQAYGTEISRDRIEYATAHGVKVIGWDEIPAHQFDFINAEQVFEHLAEPLVTLRHLARALKPEGVVKISVPTAPDIRRRLRVMDWNAEKGSKHSLNPVAPLEHLNLFRRKSLVQMAEGAALREVFLPLWRQYQFSTGWSGLKRIAKNFYLPLARNLLRNRNYLFFTKAD